ncbi:MAG: hypothetical protein IT371_14700 [Deltaproteobacteria bacterium]|nr:hypothetical protein [Deltaproteobacteria bacterium]
MRQVRFAGLGLALVVVGCGDPLELERHTSSVQDAGAPARDGGNGRPGLPQYSCLATLPPRIEPSPPLPADTCDWMDWNLSSDGFYHIGRFGTSEDKETYGRMSTCGGLQAHYTRWCCLYDIHTKSCADGQTPLKHTCKKSDPRVPQIPWAKGHVSYNVNTVVGSVSGYFFDLKGKLKPAAETMNFPHPEYFYVADAQRFGCGAVLRITNTENGRCIVAFAEDSGPGARYEQADKGGRRAIDSSPAVHRYLGKTEPGWRGATLLYVEWGQPGDRPGQPCTPCEATPAITGTESRRTIFDVNHFDGGKNGLGCRFPKSTPSSTPTPQPQ